MSSERRSKTSPNPDQFDERAKENAQKVTKIHEFRRGNIREMDAPQQDPFDYEPEEKESQRYDALRAEHLFRYGSTYKALKWGISVGAMFAMHRYYRTRSVHNAAHWFTVMSFVSFFNIWVSYGMQEFVTDYGTRKSVSLQQRNQYQNNAYKDYVSRVAEETHSIDKEVMPVLDNDTGKALDRFIGLYQ